MAKLVIAKCPRCGAGLEFEGGLKSAHCSYCSSNILIEDDKPVIIKAGSDPEFEKKKYGLELERKELGELRLKMAGLNSKIIAAERGNPAAAKGMAVGLSIIFIMVIMMDAMMWPMFYFLGISYIWGVSDAMCMFLGILMLIIGIVGIIGTLAGTKHMQEMRRQEALRSPEYINARNELPYIQEQVRRCEERIDRIEDELRAMCT